MKRLLLLIPAIKFASLSAGDYRLEYEGALYGNGSGTNVNYQFWEVFTLMR